MPRSSSDKYSATTSALSYFDGEKWDTQGSLGAAIEEDSFGEIDSDEYVMVEGKNGRWKWKIREEGEGAMEAKKSNDGQKSG